jgi:hypothetical protein
MKRKQRNEGDVVRTAAQRAEEVQRTGIRTPCATDTSLHQHGVMDIHCNAQVYNVQLRHASAGFPSWFFAWTRSPKVTVELNENQKVAEFVLQLFPSCLHTTLFR